MKKRYYQLILTATSPLSLGSGKNEATDADILCDKTGKPFLPGSSLAGALRSVLPPAEAEALFGSVTQGARRSLLYVSDGRLVGGYTKTVRDQVALTENHVAADGAKFDREAIEPGARFSAVLETEFYDAQSPLPALCALLAGRVGNTLFLGGKTGRGYGRMQADWRLRDFALDTPAEFAAWQQFDPFAAQALFDGTPAPEPAPRAPLAEIAFAVPGGVVVRQYSTVPGAADYGPLALADGTPVIPGTSWAGLFRHRMRTLAPALAPQYDEAAVFGTVAGDNPHPSLLRFGESTVAGAALQTVTRTAIDRFTAAAADRSLFTENIARGGVCTLQIESEADPLPAGCGALLAATLLDLHYGILGIGGEGSVGRGTLQITKVRVRGQDVTDRLLKDGALTIFEGGEPQ